MSRPEAHKGSQLKIKISESILGQLDPVSGTMVPLRRSASFRIRQAIPRGLSASYELKKL